MSKTVEIKVPDIGDFDKVEIIEVLVSAGDQVEQDDSLIVMESDKATLDVPSSEAGKIVTLKVSVGDKVGEGDVIATLELADAGAADSDQGDAEPEAAAAEAAAGADDDTQAEGDSTEIRVPDIGDFDKVEIIEVLVSEGDDIGADESLLVLESDKATLDVPSPSSGKVSELKVKVGDKVGEGDLIAILSAKGGSKPAPKQDAPKKAPEQAASKSAPASGSGDYDTEVVVIGAGPGGYTAAFRAADLGLKTTLIEAHETLGGVCLNVGCIPSKALLHSAHVMDEAAEFAEHGITFGEPKIDIDKLRGFKESVVGKLTGGLVGLAKQRKVTVIHGTATFKDDHTLVIDGERELSFGHAIVAAGSRVFELPSFPNDDPRLISSTGALKLQDIPEEMLVVGGGIIGLEMASVYSTLGSKVDVVELTDGLVPGCDPDLTRVLQKRMAKRCRDIWVGTKVAGIEAHDDGLHASFEGGKAPQSRRYDRVLVSIGRRPNGDLLNAEAAGLRVTDRGFIEVDSQMRTNVPHIHAIGDIVGQPMLAHKATHEGKVAAEVIAGENAHFDARCIPSVVYTNPEIGWVGLTELQAKADGIAYDKGQFPWAANGRSLGMGNSEGFTKLLSDPETGKLLGGAAVGPNAGELIAEMGLAIEMDCDIHDIGLTIHAHPTLTESVGMAAEAAAGTLTDLYIPKKKAK